MLHLYGQAHLCRITENDLSRNDGNLFKIALKLAKYSFTIPYHRRNDGSSNERETPVLTRIDYLCGGSSETGAEEAENALKNWCEEPEVSESTRFEFPNSNQIKSQPKSKELLLRFVRMNKKLESRSKAEGRKKRSILKKRSNKTRMGAFRKTLNGLSQFWKQVRITTLTQSCSQKLWTLCV